MALSKKIDINIYYSNFEPVINALTQIDSTISNQLSKTISIDNAYIKIIGLQGNKTDINLTVGIYDKKDGNLLKSSCHSFTPNVSDTAKNFIQQGYEYIKTLDEYKDAVDLLDDGQTI
jgi:hypothetical protein